MSAQTPPPAGRRFAASAPTRAAATEAGRRHRALVELVERLVHGSAPYLVPATVVRVEPGAAEGGDDLCLVTLDEDEFPVPYPDGYSPQPGHEVQLLFQAGSPVLLHRLRGIPPLPDDDPEV